MKRRTFIKRSSIGLSAVVAGVAGLRGAPPGAASGPGRVYGVPESVRPRTPFEHNLLRLSLSRTDVPLDAWQDVVALTCLAQDVFDNPAVASTFSRDPKGYLRTIGCDDVSLDPDAVEVKVALALGDPEIRGSIDRDDPRGFLAALESRGLIRSPDSSQLARRIGSRLEASRTALDGDPSPEACSALAICIVAVWVWVAVVQDVVVSVAVAAAVTVYAYVLVSSSVVAGGGGGGDDPRKKRAAMLLEENPSLRLAGALGGADFGNRVASTFVEDNVEKIATAVESLEVYRSGGSLSSERLRGLVRAQMLRQLRGNAVDFEAPRP